MFLDSASPALLQSEAQAPPEPRLTGTGARDNLIPELGNKTFIQAWTAWIATLDAALGAKKLALIPNTGPLITGWDTTPYDLTAGVFSEGYADPSVCRGGPGAGDRQPAPRARGQGQDHESSRIT